MYQVWCRNVDRLRNYAPQSKSKMAAVRYLEFSKTWFLSNGVPWAGDFPLLYQIWCKNNVDRRRNYGPKIEIQDGGRPSSWISENLIFEQWGPLGCRFSTNVPNLVQKCWPTPKLWPKIEIQDGGIKNHEMWYYLAAHWHLGNVMVGSITFYGFCCFRCVTRR